MRRRRNHKWEADMSETTNPLNNLQAGNDVVGALFTERAAASNAIDELHYAGFGDKQVGMVVRDGSEWKVTGMGQDDDVDDAPALTSNRSGAADDAASAGPAVVVPATQTGGNTAAGSGAVPIGVAGVFAGYGFGDAAGRLSGDLEKGALLVVVKATGRSTEAKNILERNGGKMAR
jgi:hypothetical protein